MRTKLKLVLMSFGVTMLVTVGLSVVTFYTYHQGASLHKGTAVGPSPTTLSPLATHNPAIAETTTIAAPQPEPQPQPAPSDQTARSPKTNGRHDNSNSPFDDPTKVITNMGPNNPALLKSLPAFLRLQL